MSECANNNDVLVKKVLALNPCQNIGFVLHVLWSSLHLKKNWHRHISRPQLSPSLKILKEGDPPLSIFSQNCVAPLHHLCYFTFALTFVYIVVLWGGQLISYAFLVPLLYRSPILNPKTLYIRLLYSYIGKNKQIEWLTFKWF